MLDSAILTLSSWLDVSHSLLAWLTLVALVSGWWVVLWGLGKVLHGVRPVRVVILARLVIFFVGAPFVFNLAFVPVVLIALHGVAVLCLGVCMLAALLYLIRVDDRPTHHDSYEDFL